MKLGARTIKTGIGVMLAIIISTFLPHIDPTMPAFTVVLTMQQSVGKTWESMSNRIIAAFMGGLCAVIMTTLFGRNAGIIGLTVIIFIVLMNSMKLSNAISIAAMTVVIIMLSPFDSDQEIILTASKRVIESLLGVIIAFLVNLFILPPKYDAVVYDEINTTNTEIGIRLRAILRKNGEYSTLNSDLIWARRKIHHIQELFERLKEERVWRGKGITEFKRKLVIIRSFIQALNHATRLLRLLHEHTNVVFELPDSLRLEIRERIETLCAAHEQIFLKFDGRISPTEVNFFQSTSQYRQHLIDNMFKAARLSENETDASQLERSNAIILITSAIIRYEESLMRLNMLVRSYHLHHVEDKFQADSLKGIEK